ncbi:MAG: GntR family transcriptional regulator [Eubacteriaceae bacterium]|jgi:GntR family transcriptional regulator|nr:GntR family transcriptional regulator [Eubacteriaceae bacterium]
MKIQEHVNIPIFQQIAEGVEDAILSGAFLEESQVPSTTEISVTYKINPATALKGMNLLVAEGILYKKRGVGLFVAKGAVKKLKQKRKESFYENFIKPMMTEASRLEISQEELLNMMKKGNERS